MKELAGIFVAAPGIFVKEPGDPKEKEVDSLVLRALHNLSKVCLGKSWHRNPVKPKFFPRNRIIQHIFYII